MQKIRGFGILCANFVLVTAAYGQGMAQDSRLCVIGQALQELLTELRQPCTVFQQSTTDAARRQTAIERFRMEPDASSLNDKLEIVRAELAELKSEMWRSQENLQTLDQQARAEGDTDKRARMEPELKEAQTASAQITDKTEQLSIREKTILNPLQEEQNK